MERMPEKPLKLPENFTDVNEPAEERNRFEHYCPQREKGE